MTAETALEKYKSLDYSNGVRYFPSLSGYLKTFMKRVQHKYTFIYLLISKNNLFTSIALKL